jgi:hypothetical protein
VKTSQCMERIRIRDSSARETDHLCR